MTKLTKQLAVSLWICIFWPVKQPRKWITYRHLPIKIVFFFSMVVLPSDKRLHNYGKSPFLMGKSTINGHFQSLCNKLPEGTYQNSVFFHGCISIMLVNQAGHNWSSIAPSLCSVLRLLLQWQDSLSIDGPELPQHGTPGHWKSRNGQMEDFQFSAMWVMWVMSVMWTESTWTRKIIGWWNRINMDQWWYTEYMHISAANVPTKTWPWPCRPGIECFLVDRHVASTSQKSTGTGWWCNNHLEKYEFVNGKDYPIYYGKEKMFQTTNQGKNGVYVPNCGLSRGNDDPQIHRWFRRTLFSDKPMFFCTFFTVIRLVPTYSTPQSNTWTIKNLLE